ncbi:MAG: hypothetical protein LBO64_00340 [Desulfovibrio sp.]|jgi:outer membrane biogenesis lipoprotein LolB|nr:hypothetical protein [Desulfovibrio sp.]
MKKQLLLCLLLLIGACAGKQDAGVDTQATADGQWQKMATSSVAEPAPYRIQTSLRFGTEGDTRRVTALFWGNGEGALRLDVMAGVGAVAAKILEDGEHFLLYTPRENKAYFHEGTAKPLLNVGVPIPFNLRHLSDILNGRYMQVFGRHPAGSVRLADGRVRYTLDGKPGGDLVLNADGLPALWREDGDRGWKMEIVYDSLPQRLTLAHSNGNRAILLVKEREKPAVAFSAEQLRLTLPESASLLPLEKYKK